MVIIIGVHRGIRVPIVFSLLKKCKFATVLYAIRGVKLCESVISHPLIRINTVGLSIIGNLL
jgi:hypothetical protein